MATPSRDDYEFVLLPWEFPGSNFDPRPDWVVEHELFGEKRLFLVKRRANKIFFRLAEDAERIWCLPSLPQFSEIDHWRECVSKSDIGRLWVRTRRSGIATTVAVVVYPDGSAEICEWCSEIWHQAVPSPQLLCWARTRRHINIWHPAWTPGLSRMLSRNGLQLREQLQPGDQRKNAVFGWIRGSQEHLSELLRALILVRYDLHKRLECTRAKNQTWFVLHCHGLTYGNWMCVVSYYEISNKAFLDLIELFLEYNQIAGVEWEKRSGTRGTKPRDWYFTNCSVRFEFPIPTSATFHERLEATLFLREWLRGKVSDEEAERLLSLSD